MANAPGSELVVSPRWTVTVGNIDGTPHVLLRIEHPRLGPIDFLLPDNDAIEFAAALEKTWERRGCGARRRRAPIRSIRCGHRVHAADAGGHGFGPVSRS